MLPKIKNNERHNVKAQVWKPQYTTQLYLRQPFVATAATIAVPTIPAIRKRNFFSVKSVILNFLWHLCINQRQKHLSNWRRVLIYCRYFSDQTSRRLLFSFVQVEIEYSAYWAPCSAAVIDHSHNLSASGKTCMNSCVVYCGFKSWSYASHHQRTNE